MNGSNRSLNDTMVLMKSIFITFGLSQEATKVQQSHFLTAYNNWIISFCFC